MLNTKFVHKYLQVKRGYNITCSMHVNYCRNNTGMERTTSNFYYLRWLPI